MARRGRDRKDARSAKEKAVAGFDDTRIEDYIALYNHLAIAAARAGDDDAAAAFLANSKAVDRTKVRREGDADDIGTDARFSTIETLFAGAAEGRLPRKYLHLFLPAFLRRSEALRTCYSLYASNVVGWNISSTLTSRDDSPCR